MNIPFESHPSEIVWPAIADLAPTIRSWLDVGAGHAGPFMAHHIARLPLERREVFDLGPIRQMPSNWNIRRGDARELWSYYRPGEFDVVVCTEVWEHLDFWGAMYVPEMLTRLARLAVVFTTTDDSVHAVDRGSGQRAHEQINVHQRFQRCWQDYAWLWSGEGWRRRVRGNSVLLAVWRADGGAREWAEDSFSQYTSRAQYAHDWWRPRWIRLPAVTNANGSSSGPQPPE